VLSLRKIAVTGGLASGKSTVCQIFKECGAYVVDADKIVRRLLSQEGPAAEQVVKLLGTKILTNNQIDRKKISNNVFANPSQLKALESILHPLVRQEINRLFTEVKNNPAYRFFVAEVPLLYEAGMEPEFDAVVAVIADEATARTRSTDLEEFDRRSRFQLTSEVKEKKATYVIKNQGTLTALKAQVTALVPQILL
jgi:dephospho-CoA kinase